MIEPLIAFPWSDAISVDDKMIQNGNGNGIHSTLLGRFFCGKPVGDEEEGNQGMR